MKKIFLISLLFLFLIPYQTLAGGTDCPTGLVPCGTTNCPCEFCDFFVLINNIVQFVMVKVVPPIAVLMLIAGGVMFMLGSFSGAEMLPGGTKGGPKLLNQARGLITSAVIGLIIIYAAFLIVGTILSAIGLADWTQEIYRNWWQEGIFQIKCQ